MTRTTKTLASLLLFFAPVALQAQNDSEVIESFKKYRDKMMSDYQDFRNKILSDYGAFLDSAWSEYATFAGIPLPSKPKPVVQPQAPPNYEPPVQPKPVVEEETSKPQLKPQPAPKPQPVPKPTPPPSPSQKMVKVELYGIEVALPSLNMQKNAAQLAQLKPAEIWDVLVNSDVEEVAQAIYEKAEIYSLGDWGTFKLVQHYAESSVGGSYNAVVCAQTALLLIMGYKVSMALTESGMVMLLPFEQNVCDNTFVKINDEKYYLFPDGKYGSISTPDVGQMQGRKLDLVNRRGVRLPLDAKPFSLSYGGIAIHGNVNRNTIRMIDEYPVMQIQDYAATVFDAELRKDVIKQIESQIDVRDPLRAANDMLHFTQLAFNYKTDEEQFGHEKYFFFEELLYYPYSDCEDRSVFFANLVRNILRYDVLLVGLPNHEATAVALPFEPPKRNYVINVGSTKYYICDPTYMRADVGMMHENYFNSDPELQEW